MIGAASSRKVRSIVLWTLSTMWCVVPTARCREICNSTTCKEVAKAYDSSVNLDLRPCSDFFTFVCSGWMQKMKEVMSNKTDQSFEFETFSLLERQVIPRILSKEIRRIRDKERNISSEGLPKSDLQPTMYFLSCLRARKKNDWGLTTQTVRKFFHEVGLPFFDEPIDPETTAFSALLKLALQFDIKPLFRVEPGQYGFFVSKATIIDKLDTIPSPVRLTRDRYTEWKRLLLSHSQARSAAEEDTITLTRFAATFDAFHIRLKKKTILRIGRNVHAVTYGIKNYMRQGKENYTFARLSEYSDDLESTYFELFKGQLGNLATPNQEYWLMMISQYFKPMVLLTKDANLSQIFYDFIGYHILEQELKEVIGRTKCGRTGFCNRVIESRPVRHCGVLVSTHPDLRYPETFQPTEGLSLNKLQISQTNSAFPWSTVLMVARGTHSEYTALIARYAFSLYSYLLGTVGIGVDAERILFSFLGGNGDR